MPKTSHVTPERWTPRGEAWVAGRERYKPMIVWGGIPGEGALVRVAGSGQHQIAGEWLESRKPSPHRVEPPCERFNPCGGCPWMHLEPSYQEASHRSLVRMAMDEAGVSDARIDAWHPSPDGHADFRYVVKLGVEKNELGKTKIGAWGRGNRKVVPIPKCIVAAPVLNKVMASFAHHTLDLDIYPFEPENGRGVIRAAVLRASRATGEVLVTLVAARNSRRLVDLAEAIAGACSEVVGVWLHLNDEPGNAIYARDEYGAVRCLPLVGKDHIAEVLNGVEYRIGPGDFFQTNPAMAEVLYRRTLDRLEPGPEDAFLDLYSGVGGLALQAAHRGVGFAVGVEEIEGAVSRARTATRLNRLTAEFLVGRVDQVGPDLVPRLAPVGPLVVVNPARRGLEDGVVEQLASFMPRRLAYISCNPMALARDLKQLRSAGFKLRGGLELFDMFPNTAHVEVLAVLDGRAPEGPQRRAPRRKVVRRG